MASDKLYPAFARLLLIPAALIAAATAATAEPQCLCRYDGKRFEQGQCTCIVISGNARYACCDRVLNNSSWTFVSDQCEAETSRGEAVEIDTTAARENKGATKSVTHLSTLMVPDDL